MLPMSTSHRCHHPDNSGRQERTTACPASTTACVGNPTSSRGAASTTSGSAAIWLSIASTCGHSMQRVVLPALHFFRGGKAVPRIRGGNGGSCLPESGVNGEFTRRRTTMNSLLNSTDSDPNSPGYVLKFDVLPILIKAVPKKIVQSRTNDPTVLPEGVGVGFQHQRPREEQPAMVLLIGRRRPPLLPHTRVAWSAAPAANPSRAGSCNYLIGV